MFPGKALPPDRFSASRRLLTPARSGALCLPTIGKPSRNLQDPAFDAARRRKLFSAIARQMSSERPNQGAEYTSCRREATPFRADRDDLRGESRRATV